MARRLRAPPKANPELFGGGDNQGEDHARVLEREAMVMAAQDSTPVKMFDRGAENGAAPRSTAKSVMDEDPTKVSPRGKEIQENPPFEDPLFNQMVQEEMRRIEAELQAELDTQSQLLEGASISPEGKQLAAHLAGTGTTAASEDVHPYAIREGINDMRNHSPVGGAGPPPKFGLADDNDPDYNTKIVQPPAPASPARQGAGDSPINLKNWKREGFPSEYAYAMAMGELDKRPKQAVRSVAEVGVREEKSFDQLLSPARKKGQGGLSSFQVQQIDEKRKAQERYNQQLHEDRLLEERRKQAEASEPPRARMPPPGRGDFDLSGYVDEQQQQQQEPSQGVYGVTANTEKQMKRAKQEEYRRQLDAETGGAPPAPGRRERSLDPAEERDVVQGDAPPSSNGFVSSVKIRGEQPSYSENEGDAAKAAKKRQQLEYRRALEQQMEEVKAAKKKYKAEKEEEDRELLEAAANLQMQNEPRAKDAPGREASNSNINSFEPSSENMMVMEYNLAKTRKAGAPRSPDRARDRDRGRDRDRESAAPDTPQMGPPPIAVGGRDMEDAAIAAEMGSPGKARQRLISDVYGSSAVTAHAEKAHPEADSWRPGGRNNDDRKQAAMNEQKAILLRQMEEVRQRKEQEKEKERREEMDDERRVRNEMAQMALQQGLNPMAAPGANPDSPARRGYGNPVGNNSSQMGNQLGSMVGDAAVPAVSEDGLGLGSSGGGGELSEGYNTRVKRLSPDQRAKLQESIQSNYQPLEALPSKAVQRQRAHQAQAEAEAAAAARYQHRSPAVAAQAPARQYRSPPRAGLPSGAPSKENPAPSSPRSNGVEFMQAVQERAVGGGGGAYDLPDSLDAQTSFQSATSHSAYDSFEAMAAQGGLGMKQMQMQMQMQMQAPPPQGAHHGVDNFRPTSAEEVDSFLVNWQRQINMPQPRSGYAIPLVPPKQGLGAYAQPQPQLRGSIDSAMSSYHIQAPPAIRLSQESTTGDVSFVSDSRLIPSNPWDPSGLLAALGPGNPISGPGQPPVTEASASSALANVGKAALGLDGPKQTGEFHLPSERGKLQAGHLTDVGTAAAQMEKSLTSDSLLMYLGSRTPMNPNNLGVDQALRDAHKNPFSVDGSQATNPFGSPGSRSQNTSVELFEEAAQGPESPLTKLVKAHSRPGTGGSAPHPHEVHAGQPPPRAHAHAHAHAAKEKSPSPPKFKKESEASEEDEILVMPSPKAHAGAKAPSPAHATPDRTSPIQVASGPTSPNKAPSPTAFQVHHSPTKTPSPQQQLQLQQQQSIGTAEAGAEQVADEEDYDDEAYDEDEEDGILPTGPAAAAAAQEQVMQEAGASGFKKWDPAAKEGTHSAEALLDSALGLDTAGAAGEGDVVDEEEEPLYPYEDDQAGGAGVEVGAEVNITNIPISADAALTSSAMNYEEEDYEDDYEDGADGGAGSFNVKVTVMEGRGIGPAKFVALDEEGNGPEPFVVLSVANHNYASDRAVGIDPMWQQELDLNWDGFSLVHVQCMDQNEVDTEVLGDKHLDLSILGLDYGVPMPVELPLDNGYQEGAVLFLEVTLNPPA